MGIHKRQQLFLVAGLLLFGYLPLPAQTSTQASQQSTRQRALTLFREGKRLEALSLLEEVTQANPQDSEVLVALAASLVEHAATVTPPEAAAKERFRARNLLQKAWSLGNTSPLAENLRQLLDDLPANGSIKFSDNPAIEQAMNAGEAAFARRDFDQALRDYAKALEVDPANYTATLFSAHAYDKKNDFADASDWYERAMHLNPDIETAYRYYADMLAKQGDMAKARAQLIHAAVAEPYNKIVWREIRAWAIINKTAFNLVYVGIPVPSKVDATSSGKESADLSSAWRAYYSVKSEWKKDGKFQRRFPQEPEYRHSLSEESEALTASAKILESFKEDPKTAAQVFSDPAASLLLKLYESGLLDAYTLFSLGDDGIAKDYATYRANHRDKLESYLDRFVVPPAASPN